MKTWIVYILRCADSTLYTGITKDLKKRIEAHNLGKGAKYTRSRRPVELVWHKKSRSESAARKREAKIKRWTKSEKEDFIGYSKRTAKPLAT